MRYRYQAKKPFARLYSALMLLGVLLTLARWASVFVPGFVLVNAEVHSHISNFSLSMIAYLGVGYSWLLFGRRLLSVTLLGVALTAANLVCETLMGFMNTPDIIDAVYGAAGVLAAYAYLLFLHKYGLAEKPAGPQSQNKEG